MTISSHISLRHSLAAKILAVLAFMGSVAGILTAIMTWANVGFGPSFLLDWGLSFAKAFSVLMPIAMMLMAALGKLAERYFPEVAAIKRNVGLGFVMSVIMQSLVAATSAGTAVGIADSNLFRQAWANAFVSAFPVGLALALLLTTLIKPRLESFLRR